MPHYQNQHFSCSEWLAVHSPSFLYLDLKINFCQLSFLKVTRIYLSWPFTWASCRSECRIHCKDNVYWAGLEFKIITMIWKGMVDDAFWVSAEGVQPEFCQWWRAGQCHYSCCSQLSSFSCDKIYITTLLPICHTAQSMMWIESCFGVPTFISSFHIHGTRSCQWNIVRKYRKLSLPLEFIGVKALYKVSDFTVGSLYTWKELIYVLQLHKVIKVQLRQVFIILIYKHPMTFSEQITYSGIHDHSYNQMPSRIDCIF